MRGSENLLSILAAGLIMIALVLRVVLPSTMFIGIASRFFRINAIASWLLIFAGVAIAMVVILRIILRNQNIR